MNDAALVLLLLPILAIQLGLMVFALWDLTRPERHVRGDSKLDVGPDRRVRRPARPDHLPRRRTRGAMSGVAVGTRGLTKRFGGPGAGVLAVDGLDLDVPAGSVFGLLGPERRRQDHDAPAHHRPRGADLGLGDRSTASPSTRATQAHDAPSASSTRTRATTAG